MAAHLHKKYPNCIVAEPDDPIYSQGWTIGSATPSKRSTTTSQQEDLEKPDTKTLLPEETESQGE